ncbi:MAG: hypothetical protein L0Z62_13180 [Gemmataceae bacterium]|nr:hypothetical protein [Gemmataceae bacterium]
MITPADRITLNWIRTLAHLRSQLAEFRRQLLYSRKPVGVEWGVECNAYESGLVLTAYVDADLGDGRALVWWLDVTHDGEQWRLDPSVTWNGQDPILPLEERTVAHAEDLAQELPQALAELLNTYG